MFGPNRILLLMLALTSIYSCHPTPKKIPAKLPRPALRIAFGSCSDQEKEQILWEEILAEQPDIWIWLGDNIYGDSEDMELIKQKYQLQKSHPLYQQLIKKSKILGTWDDHDYGTNDGGKEFPARDASQSALLDFLDVPEDDIRRSRPGVYTAYDVDLPKLKVKIILLDTRYFRDEINRILGVYQPNYSGTILGEAQWQWLKTVLSQSRADVHIIASSIQFLPEEHRFEKWANFPKERLRMLQLLDSLQIKRPIFISGDRHIGEISFQKFSKKSFYEITSSSLTHGWSLRIPEKNQHRIGNIVYDMNYGILDLYNSRTVRGYLKSEEREIIEFVKFKF